MSATTAIIHLLKTGDHVVSIDDVYGGTQRYFRKTVAPVRTMCESVTADTAQHADAPCCLADVRH